MSLSEQIAPERETQVQETFSVPPAEEGTETAGDVTALPETAPEEPAETRPAPAAAEEAPAEDAAVSRLADEFLALCEEMEGIAVPEDLPDEVWETAAQGVPLRDAYLRFWYAEHTRRQAATCARERSAGATAGSLRDLPDDPRPEEAAFARSFRTAVD